MSSNERITREHLFMQIAQLYALRSSCPRAHVGVVAVRDGRVVASGYNGAPAGMRDCLDVGCDLLDDRCVRAVHAEANLIAWAARTGTELEGTNVFCNWSPCYDCAKLLANAGVQRLWWKERYHPDDVDLIRRIAKLPLTLVDYHGFTGYVHA